MSRIQPLAILGTMADWTPTFGGETDATTDDDGFELLAEAWLKERYPSYVLVSNRARPREDGHYDRPDFVLSLGDNVCIVADAKRWKVLTKTAIKKVIGYCERIHPDEGGFVFVPDHCTVSDKLKQFSLKNRVRIVVLAPE